jgi:cytochrome c oxidase subunit IV
VRYVAASDEAGQRRRWAFFSSLMGRAMALAHTHPNYIAIFWWLLALTILEVGVIFLPIARVLIAILLVGLALSKAALVAMYFMHLKFERPTLGLIAVTPLLLCVLLVFALLPDSTGTLNQTSGAPAAPAASGSP